MRIRSKFAVAVFSILFCVVAVAPTPAAAGPADDEATFLSLINQLRSSHGLGALQVDAQLTAQARSWSQVMANDGQLKHAPDLSVGVSANWDLLGENVGVHSIHDINGLFQAFVNSPNHLANLLDPRFDYVGVGVVHGSDGRIWTTHRFMSAGAPAPPPTSPPAPAPTAPPTVPVAPPTSPTVPIVPSVPTPSPTPTNPPPVAAPTSAPDPNPDPDTATDAEPDPDGARPSSAPDPTVPAAGEIVVGAVVERYDPALVAGLLLAIDDAGI